MAGVRLYHPTVRPEPGAQYAVYVVETDNEYPVPYACRLCGRLELNKSIHLRIGPDGYVIVSPEIFEKLRPSLSASGLEQHEVIQKPPDQVLGAVELPKQHIIHVPLNGDKKYTDKYNPGRTKYESRNRLLIPRFIFGKEK